MEIPNSKIITLYRFLFNCDDHKITDDSFKAVEVEVDANGKKYAELSSLMYGRNNTTFKNCSEITVNGMYKFSEREALEDVLAKLKVEEERYMKRLFTSHASVENVNKLLSAIPKE